MLPSDVVQSPLLADLFHPAAVAASELRGTCEPGCLMPEELRCVPHAWPKRRQELRRDAPVRAMHWLCWASRRFQ